MAEATLHFLSGVVDAVRNLPVGRGLEKFRQEVKEGVFPEEQYSPYKMSADEEQAFKKLLAKDEKEQLERPTMKTKKLREHDEYETIKVDSDDDDGKTDVGGSPCGGPAA